MNLRVDNICAGGALKRDQRREEMNLQGTENDCL